MRNNKSFILRDIYGKKVLIPTKANEVGDEPILMNDVGADIWNEADCADSLVSLVDSITKKYNLYDGSVEQQAVKEFICNLIDLKLIFV